ncbi:MAG: alpha/beta hydrolase [Planctomycetota bacterium]
MGKIITPIVLLPGLGADAELFYPQQEHFGEQLRVCTGPAFETLQSHSPSLSKAAEFTAELIRDSVSNDDRFILGGMSFGGSLAMEMVRMDLLKPSAIVLISSNRTSSTLSDGFRWQQRIGSKLPTRLIRSGLGFASRVFAYRESLSSDQTARLRRMAGRANIEQLLWGAQAIDRWKADEDSLAGVTIPIHQIHGVADWVIPIHRQHVTKCLDDGRHLITWTHSHHVNRLIESAQLEER